MAFAGNVHVVLKGLDDFHNRVREKIDAFERAANDLAELCPGSLQIDIRILDPVKGQQVVDFLKKNGMNLEMEKQVTATVVDELPSEKPVEIYNPANDPMVFDESTGTIASPKKKSGLYR